MKEREPETIGEALRAAATHHGDVPSLILDEEILTFRELDDQADIFAQALLEHGVRKGDHIGVWLPTSTEWIVAFCAIARIGAVIVPINTRYKPDEVGYLLKLCDVKLLITQPIMWNIDTYEVLNEIGPGIAGQISGELSLTALPALHTILMVADTATPGTTTFDAFIGAAKPDQRLAEAEKNVGQSDRLLICSTSGSTGKPKGVMHAHRALKHCRRVADIMSCEPGDRMLAHWPLHHAGGCFSMLTPALLGPATMVAVPHWEGDVVLDLIERHKVTMMGGVATHYFDLVVAQKANPRDLSSLKLCWIGGSPLSKESYDHILQGMKISRLPSTYGMTENSTSLTFNRPEDPGEICRDNRAPVLADAEVKIVDPESLDALPSGQVGEIWCRGDIVMDGYYGDPDMTSRTVTPEGWLRTGDLGFFDAAGYLKPTGRLKEMYKVGGSNVSPTEVELCLNEYDGVMAAVAVGVPDDRLMEVGFVFVQLEVSARLEEADITEFCRTRLADYKVPRYVKFIEEFPRLAIGKIDRKALANEAREIVGKTKI